MVLTSLTLVHVVLSLIGIGSGCLVLWQLLASKWNARLNNLFLTTTAATSLTGFLFPIHGFTPGLAVGILSLVVLLIAFLALYRHGLQGGWRRTYVIAAVVALYFNVFVLIVQLFEKVPPLEAIAPTQSEPPFQITQLTVLLLFATLGTLAAVKFHGEPSRLAH